MLIHVPDNTKLKVKVKQTLKTTWFLNTRMAKTVILTVFDF